MQKVALAAAAHPDDIEFMMAGTLMLLKQAGYEIHYMNVANGSCGTAVHSREEIIRIRDGETRQACATASFAFHPPLVDDLQIYYTPQLVSRLCAVVRQVKPQILLVPSPNDYMEDHSNVSRLMVTAAFCRNMRNFVSDPVVAMTDVEMAVYHALPYGLKDQLRNTVTAQLYIDVSSVIDAKRNMLACHRSQKEWLDASQGLDSYLNTMQEMCGQVGAMSGRWKYAEGWRRHSHLAFGAESFDPLSAALADRVCESR